MSAPGRTLADRYELVSRLGAGGMGVVWRARDTRLGRAVAVKLLAADMLGSELARKRLLREARAAAALEHDGIIHVYDVGETDDGGAFLVMELVRGQSLRDVLEKGPLSVKHAVDVIAQVARALHVAHQAGVVHRDIKPDNIMIRENGAVLVVDFGVAKPVATEIVENADTLAAVSGAALTHAGQLVGTPAYLSPEQARGVAIGPASDQFALAVTAFEAMTGKLPWRGTSAVEVVAAILKDAPDSLVAERPDAPPELDRALARALAKAPDERYEDVGAFAKALEAATSSLPDEPGLLPSVGAIRKAALATPADALDPRALAVTAPATSQTKDPAAPEKRVGGRRAWLAIGAGAFVVAVGVLATRGKPAEKPAVGAAPTGPVACVPLKVNGSEDHWLGAAAATLACERVALARAGLDAKTRTPAELVGASTGIDINSHTYFDDAKDRDVAIAAAGNGRVLSGTLQRDRTMYAVRITLEEHGKELASGEGKSVEIFEAVRDAMKPVLPVVAEEETRPLREWLDVRTPEQASDLLDVRTSILIEDLVSLKEACAKVARRTDLEPRVLYLAKSMCAKKLRTARPAEPPPALDDSTPGALITTALAQLGTANPAQVRELAGRLESARAKAALAEGRARLATAAGELYNSIGDDRATSLARMAILDSPKAVDWRTSAWHRLAFSSEGDQALGIALQTWHTWEPVAQSIRVQRGVLADISVRETYTRRAYLLGQRGFYAYAKGAELIGAGHLEEARLIAEGAQDETLAMELLLGEARYGAAVEKATRMANELPATDETAAQMFLIAAAGAKASMILGRSSEFVDTVVQRWVEVEPHHVVDGVVPYTSLLTACCAAPRAVGKRCIGRLQALRKDKRLPVIFGTSDIMLNGAAKVVADDYVGGSREWRTLLRTPGFIQDALREPMAIVFDAAGELDLADELDGPSLALVNAPRTADLAWVRGARRAQKRGDVAKARLYAQAVVDKWRFAADDIPHVAEMKKLLALLPK